MTTPPEPAQLPVDELATAPAIPTKEAKKKSSLWAWIIVWGLVFALLAMIAIGLSRTMQGPIKIGDQINNFKITTFEGETILFDDHRGEVIVLNFWASWCLPCEQEAADLQAAWEMLEPRGDVLFIGADYVDTEPQAMGYLNKFNITYPNGPDLRTELSQAFRISGVPETYIIDKEGKLAYKKIGPFISLNEIMTAIDPLLAE